MGPQLVGAQKGGLDVPEFQRVESGLDLLNDIRDKIICGII